MGGVVLILVLAILRREMFKCPSCGQRNSGETQRCQCGYEFQKDQVKSSQLDLPPSGIIEIAKAQKNVIWLLLVAIGANIVNEIGAGSNSRGLSVT